MHSNIKKELFYYVIFIFCLLSTASCSSSLDNKTQTPPTPDTKNWLSIATYNVHFLFDTHCDSTGGCDQESFERMLSPKSYQNKLDNVARAIKYIDADIIMLQEIEKEQCLNDLKNKLPDYPYSAFGETGRNASLDVAILSKWPIKATNTYRKQSLHEGEDGKMHHTLARELLHCQIQTPCGKNLNILTTHFYSKVSDPQAKWRIEEAKFVADILNDLIAQQGNTAVFFGGDLNDDTTSQPIQALLSPPWQLASAVRSEIQSHTWRNHAFDHIIYNANAPIRINPNFTFRICDHRAASTEDIEVKHGLDSSDHCAYRMAFNWQ